MVGGRVHIGAKIMMSVDITVPSLYPRWPQLEHTYGLTVQLLTTTKFSTADSFHYLIIGTVEIRLGFSSDI